MRWLYCLSEIGFIAMASCSQVQSDTVSGETSSTESNSDSGSNTADQNSDMDISSCAVDVHNHFSGGVAFSDAAVALIERMDGLSVGTGTGIAFALIQPPPQGDVEEGAHYDYTDDLTPSLQEVVAQYPDRLGLVAGGGILSTWMHGAAASGEEITENELTEFRLAAEEILSDGAVAFGEMTTLHLSYKESHPYLEVPADHPLFLELADVAAENGVPIDIHFEPVGSESIDVPEDLPSECFDSEEEGGNNPTSLTENIEAFETLLDRNQATADSLGMPANAKIVWSHVGWDNTGFLTTELLDELLGAHPNLYASIKMLDELGPCQLVEHRPLDETGALREEWQALFEKYPDRFVLGSDEFAGDSGGPGSASAQGTWDLIGQLSSDLAAQFACDTPRFLYNLE